MADNIIKICYLLKCNSFVGSRYSKNISFTLLKNDIYTYIYMYSMWNLNLMIVRYAII